MTRIVIIVAIAATVLIHAEVAMADDIQLKLQSIEKDTAAADKPRKVIKEETWAASQTALIVCDVWDYHHCLNAVRRLEEFAPRLDQVLKAARDRGAIIIHAPSDCMPAYVDHPARLRAIHTPPATPLPDGINTWYSRLSQEGRDYPIDQSDGGEDDDPQEHAAWAAKLKALGRNPGMPWKKQSDMITIDPQRDYITDRGDEVWKILERNAIRHVILTGVHCNMCVLGRPFGLRQMVRNKKQVVLMRDLTDSMYSPNSWPYVDHFTGHEMVLDYVEEHICPTITSDQFLGGEPFRWKADQRTTPTAETPPLQAGDLDFKKRWITVDVQSQVVQNALKNETAPVWYRGALPPLPIKQLGRVSMDIPDQGKVQMWINGHELQATPATLPNSKQIRFQLPPDRMGENDYHLIVIKTSGAPSPTWHVDFIVQPGRVTENRSELKPFWQVRVGDDDRFSNIPLPAKFGMGPDAILSALPHQKAK